MKRQIPHKGEGSPVDGARDRGERNSGPRNLSVVIPCYNEEEVLPVLFERLAQVFERITCPVEYIFVDDGSRDRTLGMPSAFGRPHRLQFPREKQYPT